MKNHPEEGHHSNLLRGLQVSSITLIDPRRISFSRHDHPEEIQEIWKSLEKGYHYVFQRYEFIRHWCDIVAPSTHARPAIFLLSWNDEPALILPLCVVKERGLNFLEFMDGGVSDYNAPVLASCLSNCKFLDFHDVWKRIMNSLPEIDGARLRKMPRDIMGIPNPMLQLGCRHNETSGYYLDLLGSSDKARTLVKEASKKYRRLCRTHEVTMNLQGGNADLLDLLIGFRDSKYRWNPPNKLALIQFYRALLQQTNLTRMFWICVDSQLIAAQFALVSEDVCTGIIVGYSPAWADFSPGRILLSQIIGRLKEEGFSAFDGGYGNEAYKQAYSSHERALNSSSAGTSIRGRIYLRGYWLTRQAYRTMRQKWYPQRS